MITLRLKYRFWLNGNPHQQESNQGRSPEGDPTVFLSQWCNGDSQWGSGDSQWGSGDSTPLR